MDSEEEPSEAEQLEHLTDQFYKIKQDFLKEGVQEESLQKFMRCHLRNPQNRKLHVRAKPGLFKVTWQVVIPCFVAVVLLTGLVQYIRVQSWLDDWSQTSCLINAGALTMEMARPINTCSFCQNITSVQTVSIADITEQIFVDKYAFTGVPVLITNAATHWKALEKFSLDFFIELYKKYPKSADTISKGCQFFSYDSQFTSLGDAFEKLRLDTMREQFWYFGWSNCDERINRVLQQYHERPSFLPSFSSRGITDWVFMGTPGPGAYIHLDFVRRPTWQAQISGSKSWQLVPLPECCNICTSLEVTVQKGDIFVLDTNLWYHSTRVLDGDISISYGAEFD